MMIKFKDMNGFQLWETCIEWDMDPQLLPWEITFSFSIFLGTIKFVAGEILLQVEVKLFVEFLNCLLDRLAHSQISRRKINFKNSIILVTKPDRELVMGRNLI